MKPGGGPADQRASRSSDVPGMTTGQAVLVGLIDRYFLGVLDPFVTLLEVHNLLYFMQVAGEPLGLRFVKGRYGPHPENLGHLLNAIEGHMVSGYADGDDVPDKELELVSGAIEDATVLLESRPKTRERIDKVGDLIEGFELPLGLELLSTVHWVVEEEKMRVLDDAVRQTLAWNERKRRFSRRQIGIAFGVLSEKGWI